METFKRILSFLLVVVLLVGVVPPVQSHAAETETTIPVETTDPTEATDESVPEESEPPVIITRAQWLSMLVNTFDYSIPDDVELDRYYTDLYDDHEYYYDILIAIYAGLVDILPNNPMEPDEPATREFAAFTLNSCIGGYPAGEEYSFSDAQDTDYPNDAQVAVDRGWFALSEGAFLPDEAITEAEVEIMLADAEAYLESLIIDEEHENGYTFKEGVVEITDRVEIEFGENDKSTVKIYDITQPLEEGDTFVVYSDGLAIPFRADSLMETAEYTQVSATDLYFEDAIESMDVQLVTATDPLNFTAAEGVDLVFIEEDSGNVVSAEYASYAMNRDAKKVYVPKFTKSFDLGGGAKIDVEVEFKNATLNYNVDFDLGWDSKASVSVWLDGDADVTTKLSCDSLFFEPIEIPVGAYEVPGVGGIGLFFKCDVTGSISLVMKNHMKVGMTMTFRPFLPTVSTAIHESKPYSSSINADITAKACLECKLGFYGKALPLKGYLFAEAGFKANVKYTTYQQIAGNCTNFAAYFFAEYGAKVTWNLVGEGELAFQPDEKYMITEKNSPIKIVKHYEDGVERSKCTREDLGGTTTGDPSGLIDSGHRTSTGSGYSSSGLRSGSSQGYDDSGNMVPIYTYTLDEDKNATITKYNGNASSLSIPSSLDGYPVVAIGGSAFSGNKNLQTVVMPDSIKTIGYNAFYNCTSLRNISFPSNLTSIGSSAFYSCTSLTTVSIPDSVTAIEYHAFNNCSKLQYVKLPKNLKTLSYRSFGNCDSLKSITIPKSLETVTLYNNNSSSSYWSYQGPFNGCDNLSNVFFEAGATRVANHLFANCPGLRTITLPDTITTIDNYAFLYCTNLTSVTLGDAVTTIGTYAFYGNTNLTDVKLNENLITIGSYAFSYCTALQGITIPNTVTTINSYAFENCTALTAIVFPDSVTTISSYAFRNCSALVDVTLSNTLQTLDSGAFQNCDNLTAIHIPKSLTNCRAPFSDCNNLETVTFDEGIETVPAYLFQSCNGLISIEIPETVTTIGNYAFSDASDLTSITLPDGLTTIGIHAFQNCVDLPTIKIPDSVTSVGSYCFYGCTSLTDVKLSENITAINPFTFYTCLALKEIWIPDGVTLIDREAFAGCYMLETVHLPKKLETLGFQSFRTCDALKSIEIPKNLKTVTLYNNSSSNSYWSYQGPFKDCDNLTEVTFEEGTTKVISWLFANCPGLVEINLPDTITEIGNYVFFQCKNLEKVTMEDAVTTVGEYAFYYDKKLSEVQLSANLTTIGAYAFQYCTGLPKLEIPDSVSSIGTYTFYECLALAEVNLPKSLRTLGSSAFYNCDSLTAINIPKALCNSTGSVYYPFNQCDNLANITFEEGIMKIPQYLFQDCYGLVNVVIPETVTSIGLYAFNNCVNLEAVTIPETVSTIGGYAFQGCVSLKEIDWPEAASTIYNYTFQNCDALTKITLPDTLVTIENYAFQDCDAMVSFNMPDSVTTLGSYAFQNCDLLEHVHLSESLTALPIYAFQNCDALKDIVIPDSVTTIGNAVFYDCDALKTATMGDGVTSMGTHVFYHNDALESVELSMQLTKIQQYSFYTCPKLTEVVIPYYVTAIDSYAFNASPKLAKVVTRSNLTSIASNAFSYPNLTVFHGDAGSYTESWANSNGYRFVKNEVAATGVTLSPKSLSLAKGSTASLYVHVTPANHSDAVTFKSSNEAVATVDAAGKIVAKGVGSTTIKVMVGNYSASCKITVTQIITSMSLNKSSLALNVPNTYQMVATIKPADASNQVLRWTSSNEAAATVDENGLITAVGNGTTVITAETTDGSNFIRTCTVTVTDPNNIPVTKITLNKTSANMDAMETLQLTATVAPTNAANKGIVWSSSDEAVAKVDESGLVTAYAKGTAQITASAADGFGAATTCAVTVVNTAYIITDPALLESSHDYPVNCSDSWIYTVEGALAMTVTFDERTCFEEDFDFLYLYDAENNLIGSYTGTALAGKSIEIMGNTLRIRMASDGSGTDWGFRVSEILTIGHLHTYVPVITEPTCTEEGYTTYTCAECGESYVDDIIAANGHSFTESVTAPTCKEGGYTEAACSVCGHVERTAETEALGHDLQYSQTLYPASCVAEGKAIHSCSRCSYSEVITLEALGHTDDALVTLPTCTEQGYTTYTCTVCGDVRVDDYVDAAGHTDAETVTAPTCTEPGYTTFTCTVCGHTHVGNEVNATGHSFGEWVTEGTVQTRTCRVCGVVEIICLEHVWGDWTETEAPTCTESGMEQRECGGCAETEIREIPAAGHSYAETIVPPTCTDEGYTDHTCTACGDSYQDSITEALGHEVEEGVCIRCETVFISIVTQPENVTAADGEIIRVTVEAEGQDLRYAWYYKNASSTKFAKTNAFKGNAYTMSMSEARSGRRIYCVITDANGYSMTTDTVLLSLAEEPPVTILTQPESVTVVQGETAEVSVEAVGQDLIYEWYFRNAGRRSFSKTAAFDGPVYSVTMTEARSGRQIFCVITDAYGNSVTTDTVTLTMQPIDPVKIIRQPVDVTVFDGETAEVTVEATGDGLIYEWYFRNAGSSKFSKTTSFTGPSYSITMSAARNGRQVYCVITDAYGNCLTSDTVTLSMEEEQIAALEIITQPEGFAVAAGKTGEILVEAVGDGLTYEWYYKNAVGSKFTKTTSFTGPSYTLTMNASRSGRHVYCVITDKYGNSVQTDIVALNMISELELLSQPEDVVAASGETAVITVDAVGEELTYTWYFRNSGSTAFTKTTTFTGDSYSLKMTDARSGRQVYCVITDGNGNTAATDIVTLWVAR